MYFEIIIISVLIFSRDGNKANLLQLILGNRETKDGFHLPEPRYKRQAYKITDDRGPILIKGVLDGQFAVEEPEPITIVGLVSGKLENGRSSVTLRGITDGGFPIEVEGVFNGTLDVGESDLPPGASVAEARVDLTVELETELQLISITGQLKGSLQIETSQEAFRTIVDGPGPVGIHGKIAGGLIFPTGWKKIGIPDRGK